jgi:hypothetical protein
MASDTQTAGLDFGAVIAFVAPGFVVVHAVSYHLPVATAWMEAASAKEQGIGIFLFVLLASLSLGLVVSGLRWIVIDTLLHHPCLRTFAVPKLSLNWWSQVDERLPLLLTIRDNYYRYYQFYANTLVALLLWILARACADNAPSVGWPYWAVLVIVAIALLLSARDALFRYVTAVNQIIKPSTGGAHD